MRRISNLLIALATGFAALAAPLHASRADGALAIAQGPRGTWAYGTANNQPSIEDAVMVAMDYCRNNDLGIKGCKIVTTFANTCIAVAIENDGEGNAYGWATNESLKTARRIAMTRCLERTSECSIRKSYCDDGAH